MFGTGLSVTSAKTKPSLNMSGLNGETSFAMNPDVMPDGVIAWKDFTTSGRSKKARFSLDDFQAKN
jgi:hypothetical protein